MTTLQRHLTGLGTMSWEKVTDHLSGLTCAWADYDGFHIDIKCPKQAPPYTHLWAWNTDHSRLVRVRIDGDLGIVGVLSITDEGGQQVSVSMHAGLPWGDNGRLGRQYGDDITRTTFTLYEPMIALPATFVAGGKPPEGAQ